MKKLNIEVMNFIEKEEKIEFNINVKFEEKEDANAKITFIKETKKLDFLSNQILKMILKEKDAKEHYEEVINSLSQMIEI